MLNRFSGPSPMPGEAEVKYLDGDFRVVRPGAFVRCAVTNVPIPLEELKYWSVELQEAYATPEAVLQRLHPGRFKSGLIAPQHEAREGFRFGDLQRHRQRARARCERRRPSASSFSRARSFSVVSRSRPSCVGVAERARAPRRAL